MVVTVVLCLCAHCHMHTHRGSRLHAMWPHSGWAMTWSVFRGAYHVFMAYVITFFLDYVRPLSCYIQLHIGCI